MARTAIRTITRSRVVGIGIANGKANGKAIVSGLRRSYGQCNIHSPEMVLSKVIETQPTKVKTVGTFDVPSTRIPVKVLEGTERHSPRNASLLVVRPETSKPFSGPKRFA